MKIIITGFYMLMLFCGLSQNSTKTINIEDFYGKWHIDSSAENGIYNIREAVKEEYFVFLKGGIFDMEKVENGIVNSMNLGTFKLVLDTLKTKTTKGAPLMNFIVSLDSTTLRLDGTFPISESNSRKPTFFLSKKKPDDENFVVSIFRSESQMIYRNVLNDITIKPLSSSMIVDCPHCDTIYQGISPNRFIIKPGKGKISEIIISDSITSKVLEKHRLSNSYLPDPVLYYGTSKSGTKCYKKTHHLFAKYPPEMNINLASDIIKWEIHIDANIFIGEGNQITEEVLTFLEKYEGSGIISVIAVVRTADGIARKLGGAFSL